MSDETKWTPGPWFVQAGFLTVYTTSIPENKTGLTKAIFKDCGHCSDAEREANANLIAAAPELYEALEGYLEAVSGVPMRAVDCDQDEVEHWYVKAQEALAKARGEMQ